MVAFPSRSMDVLVYYTPEEVHLHEEDPSYQTKENYHWTSQQETIVLRGIQSNTKNSLILRQIKEEGAVNGSGTFPDLRQLGVKKRYMKTIKLQEHFIVNAQNLRDYCETNRNTPDDENQSFVPFYYIEGETTNDLVITVIWSTPKLISRISEKLIQDDATYKMNWYKFSNTSPATPHPLLLLLTPSSYSSPPPPTPHPLLLLLTPSSYSSPPPPTPHPLFLLLFLLHLLLSQVPISVVCLWTILPHWTFLSHPPGSQQSRGRPCLDQNTCLGPKSASKSSQVKSFEMISYQKPKPELVLLLLSHVFYINFKHQLGKLIIGTVKK